MRASRTTAGSCLRSSVSSTSALRSYNQSVIYCVIPPELADELYEKMVEYYKDNPNVTVIIDRRKEDRRRGQDPGEFREKREIRDRRRARIPGTFPETPE